MQQKPKKLDEILVPLKLQGITDVSRKVLNELIIKNHKEHDIFFNDKGFHNHLSHHLFTAFSLGASPSRLEEIYQKEVGILRPWPKPHNKITKDNFNNYLGKIEHSGDYNEFFVNEIKNKGSQAVLDEYFTRPELWCRWTSGVLHSLIHIGFGFEFNSDEVLAEGFAMVATSSSRMGPVANPVLNHDTKASHYYANARSVFDAIRLDTRFDDKAYYSDGEDRYEKLFQRGGAELINEYIGQWNVDPKGDLQEKLSELYEITVLAYASLTPPTRSPLFDFFIMHCLTSLYSITILLRHISLENSAFLLKAHFAVLTTYWVASGRPKFWTEHLLNYQPKKQKNTQNPWLDIMESALLTEDEHVAKSLRSLMWADLHLGDFGGLWLKAAQSTVDWVKGTPGNEATSWWSRGGLAWEEAWQLQEHPE